MKLNDLTKHLREPLPLLLGAMTAATLFAGSIAYSSTLPTTSNTCAVGPYHDDGMKDAIKANQEFSVKLLYESMNTNTSKYFDLGGGNQCLKLMRTSVLDLSLGMPDDLGLNMALDTILRTMRDAAYKQACDLASSSLNGVIEKYNKMASSGNGMFDVDGAAQGMVKGAMTSATNDLTSGLANRASQWKAQAAQSQVVGKYDATLAQAKTYSQQVSQRPSQFCSNTATTGSNISNIGSQSANKAFSLIALFGAGCIDSKSMSCTDGYYYQRNWACQMVEVNNCNQNSNNNPNNNCSVHMEQRNAQQCTSLNRTIASEESKLANATQQIANSNNNVQNAVDTTACQGAINGMVKVPGERS